MSLVTLSQSGRVTQSGSSTYHQQAEECQLTPPALTSATPAHTHLHLLLETHRKVAPPNVTQGHSPLVMGTYGVFDGSSSEQTVSQFPPGLSSQPEETEALGLQYMP